MKFLTAMSLLIGIGFLSTGTETMTAQGAPPLPFKDTSQEDIDDYTSGKRKAPSRISLHDDPEKGQYWELRSDDQEGPNRYVNVNRYQVARVEGDRAIVEFQFQFTAERAGRVVRKSDTVTAYLIDLTAGHDEGNVKKAWIGKPGDEPKEITVAEFKKKEPGTGWESEWEVVETKFKDHELAGKAWSGTKRTYTKGEASWHTMHADDGYFDGMLVRDESSGAPTKLHAWGDDAAPLLKWPEDILDEKEEDKKEETEKEDTSEKKQPESSGD